MTFYNLINSLQDKTQRPVVLRKRRERVKSMSNWKMFCYQFMKDHAKSDLIWNHRTREELREALDSELRALSFDKELAVQISWNYTEFEVSLMKIELFIHILAAISESGR